MKRYLSIILSLFVVLSCGQPRVLELPLTSERKVLLGPQEILKVPLDSVTSLFNSLNESIIINGMPKLLIFSQNTNRLIQYDINSGLIERDVLFPKEGPDALTGIDFSSGMHYVNSDSIIFMSSSMGKIFLANELGKVYSKFDVLNDSIVLGSFDLRSQLAYRNGSLFVQSLPKRVGRNKSEFANRRLTISEYNFKDKKLTQHPLYFTEVYQEYSFSQQLQSVGFVFSKSLDRFIISYPLSDSLYLTDFKNYYESIPFKSNLVKRAFEQDSKNKEIAPERISSYYNWLSDAYIQLMYDESSGYIYRVARSGISHEQFEASDFYTTKEVLVMDGNFNVKGKISHSGSSLMYHFFDRDGISWNANFREFNMSRNNEDTLYFEKYEIY